MRLVKLILILSYYQQLITRILFLITITSTSNQVRGKILLGCLKPEKLNREVEESTKQIIPSFTKSSSSILRKSKIGFRLMRPAIEPSRDSTTIESSSGPNSPGLLDHQLNELLQWKHEPGINYFTEQLELHVTHIAKLIKKWEGKILSSEEFDQLIKSFETRGIDQKIVSLLEAFIKDVYLSLFKSTDPNTYYKIEYEIFKQLGNQADENVLLEYMKCMEILKSEVTNHYDEYEDDLTEWKREMEKIREQFEIIFSQTEQQYEQLTDKEILHQAMLQIKVRCGDISLYDSIHQNVLLNKDVIPFDQVEENLLKKITGIRSKNYDNLFGRTHYMYEDLQATLERFVLNKNTAPSF